MIRTDTLYVLPYGNKSMRPTLLNYSWVPGGLGWKDKTLEKTFSGWSFLDFRPADWGLWHCIIMEPEARPAQVGEGR